MRPFRRLLARKQRQPTRRASRKARRRLQARKTLPLLAPLAACNVEPAPENVDQLMRTLWSDVTERRDDLLRRNLGVIEDVLDLSELEKTDARGSQQHLRREDVETLVFLSTSGEPTDAPDTTAATGIHLIDRIPCTEDQLLDVMLEPDQDWIYGTYESYERTYDDDPEAFRNGEVDQLTWSGRIEAFIPFPVGATYTYNFRAEARRVDLEQGTGFLTRTWMPTPSTWDKEGPEFEQDYQLEVWRPTLDGEAMIHIYPVWREMKAAGFSMESEGMQSITLGQMAKWDQRTGELCQEGLHGADE